ncbi:MAG TPA: AI-2E family transporter [Gemmatimonadales bacterium]|nr:AI-2E family transporter [Gemmatimonadales bacterium]
MPSNRSPLSIQLIAGVVVIAALALGHEFFIPIALALCFHALLRPVVRFLEGLHVPTALGAALVSLTALGLIVVAGFGLSGPIGGFMERAPESIAKARVKIHEMGTPFRRVSEAAAGRDSTAQQPDSTHRKPAPAPASPPASPPSGGGGVVGGSFVATVLGQGTAFLAGLIEVLVLLYLMLAAGNTLFRKLIKVVPGPDEKRTASDVLHQTESIVARYLVVTALINFVQAIGVGLAMWWIGMPDPLMWGVLTFALEFIPYVGGAINVALLLVTGFTAFSGTGKILLGPALYLVITTLQNNVISPYAYGDRLKLNPLAVMICVMFFWFIWGIPGVFLSIPIAATLKVLGDQVPRFSALGELLGE